MKKLVVILAAAAGVLFVVNQRRYASTDTWSQGTDPV